MKKLFSYVVEHDFGSAPNTLDGLCSLANCKCKKEKGRNRNLVELAEKGDWIVGTGGAGNKSAGHGKLIYAMRVDKKITLADYYKDKRYTERKDNIIENSHRIDTFALISHHFFYFGEKAIDIEKIPKNNLKHPFEKKGPGYRRDFGEEFIKDFTNWIESNYKIGVHGKPCGCMNKLCIKTKSKNKCEK